MRDDHGMRNKISNLSGHVGSLSQRRAAGSIVMCVIVAGIFEALSRGFFSANEIAGILTITASLGIIAAGVTFLMMAGEFDLSVGAMFSIVPLVMGELMQKDSLNIWIAFLVAMMIPLVIGTVHGVLVTIVRIPSFIVTLGTYFLLTGVSFIVSGGYSVIDTSHPLLFVVLGDNLSRAGLNSSIFWLIGIVVVLTVVQNRTAFGNHAISAGAPKGAARALGVRVGRIKTVAFVICAMLAGFAGVVSFAVVGSAAPGAGSTDQLLAIVAAVLGGTSLFGVTGSIPGAMIGAVILGELETGLVLVGAPGTAYEAMIGVILIIALIVNIKVAGLGQWIMRLRSES